MLHAPRQAGKTSALLALRKLLRAEGFRCVYANVEGGQTAREDTERAMRVVLGALASWAVEAGDGFLDRVWSDLLARYGPDGALHEALSRWAAADPRPLVLLIDEIDALVGDSLLAVHRRRMDRRPSPRSEGDVGRHAASRNTAVLRAPVRRRPLHPAGVPNAGQWTPALDAITGAPTDRTRQEDCNAPRKTPADRASKQQSTTRRMEGCSASPAVTVRTAMPAARAIGKR